MTSLSDEPLMAGDTATAGRRVRDQLDGIGLPYDDIPCDPELADTAIFCAQYGYSLQQSANTLLVTSKTGAKQTIACVLLAHTRLDVNHTVRKRMGVRRLSFASADETVALTGMELGGVTPFAIPAALPLWIDSRIMRCDKVILGGGNRSSKIIISPGVFAYTPNTLIIEGLAREVPDGC